MKQYSIGARLLHNPHKTWPHQWADSSID